jgi:hypothetical protein
MILGKVGSFNSVGDRHRRHDTLLGHRPESRERHTAWGFTHVAGTMRHATQPRHSPTRNTMLIRSLAPSAPCAVKFLSCSRKERFVLQSPPTPELLGKCAVSRNVISCPATYLAPAWLSTGETAYIRFRELTVIFTRVLDLHIKW